MVFQDFVLYFIGFWSGKCSFVCFDFPKEQWPVDFPDLVVALLSSTE